MEKLVQIVTKDPQGTWVNSWLNDSAIQSGCQIDVALGSANQTLYVQIQQPANKVTAQIMDQANRV